MTGDLDSPALVIAKARSVARTSRPWCLPSGWLLLSVSLSPHPINFLRLCRRRSDWYLPSREYYIGSKSAIVSLADCQETGQTKQRLLSTVFQAPDLFQDKSPTIVLPGVGHTVFPAYSYSVSYIPPRQAICLNNRTTSKTAQQSYTCQRPQTSV